MPHRVFHAFAAPQPRYEEGYWANHSESFALAAEIAELSSPISPPTDKEQYLED